MEVLTQLTYTSMYLHTHTVLDTLWVECKHTYLCMYVQHNHWHNLGWWEVNKKKKNLKKMCCFVFPNVQFFSASGPFSSPSPSPSPSAWLSVIHSCNEQGRLGLVGKPCASQIISTVWSLSAEGSRRARRCGRDTHCQIVTEQLHDQGAVFIWLSVEGVKHANGIIKRLQGIEKSAIPHPVWTNITPKAGDWSKKT